jgi:nucleoside-diphosphate-sugar epimerase
MASSVLGSIGSSSLDKIAKVKEVDLKILITGNMGYVGPAVAKYLRGARPNAILHGFDNAYFAHCLTGACADNGGRYLAVNVGSSDRNYQVRDLANAVAAAVPGTKVSINTSAPTDSRSYQVDFELYRSLAPNHQPVVDLARSIQNLITGLKRMNFKDTEFRSSELMRLKVLQGHIANDRLTNELDWKSAAALSP